jgi:hypothetical protein
VFPKDSVEPIVQLLVTELLVGERGVHHLTSLHIGPHHPRKQRLRVSWMPRKMLREC